MDSPTETRRVVNFKRLALTDLKVDIKRVPGKKELTKAFTEAGACLWGTHAHLGAWGGVTAGWWRAQQQRGGVRGVLPA